MFVLEELSSPSASSLPPYDDWFLVPAASWLPTIRLYTRSRDAVGYPSTDYGHALHADPVTKEAGFLGGRALAWWILQNPASVRGKEVIDLGSGSGLVAIAAKKAGASHVTAVENHPGACAVIKHNAAANGVDITIKQATLPNHDLLRGFGVITAADIFYADHNPGYEDFIPRLADGLRTAASQGALVLAASSGINGLTAIHMGYGTPLRPPEHAPQLCLFRAIGRMPRGCE